MLDCAMHDRDDSPASPPAPRPTGGPQMFLLEMPLEDMLPPAEWFEDDEADPEGSSLGMSSPSYRPRGN